MFTTTTEGIGLKMPTVTTSGEEKNEQSRLSSFVGAIAVADLVKSTLGPKGMDKILQPMSDEGGNNRIHITNDGATILNSVYIDNGAAKILVDISKTQDFPEFLFDERTALASFDIYSAYTVFLNNINLGFTYDYPDENIKKEIQKKLLDIKARFKYPFSLIVEAL
jgi:hypothetical protein